MTRIWIINLTHWRQYSGAALVSLVLSAVLLAVLWQIRPVQITFEGKTVSFLTFKRTAGEALVVAGVLPGDHDRIAVVPAFPVLITDGGQTRELMTAARTVGEVIQELGLVTGPLDKITPSPDQPVGPGQEIKLVRVERRTRTLVEKVPYSVIRREDERLEKGQEAVLRQGEDGAKEIIVEEKLENGRVVSQTVVAEKTIDEPIPEVLAYGTISVVSRGGKALRFKNAIIMKATAYTPGPESNPWGNGHTYTGIKAGPGIAAVDPRVIPLGSRLYVEGYGQALAADIGGAIKGNRIDLCYNEVSEALQWGVRTVKVYVLDE